MSAVNIHGSALPAVSRVFIMHVAAGLPPLHSVAAVGLVPLLARKKSLLVACSNAFQQKSRTDSVDSGGAA